MEQIRKISFKTQVSPTELHNLKLKKFLHDKYQNQFYNGLIVLTINKVLSYEFGMVYTSGFVELVIEALCTVKDLAINQVYELEITSSNKIGAFHNSQGIFIFIPKTSCLDENIPQAGEFVDIKIIGKRIENKLSCIGSMILS